MKVLSREDMQKVLIQAKEENYYELFLLEFATGLRLGELMALQWDDVDLVTGELRINKQVNLVGSKLVISAGGIQDQSELSMVIPLAQEGRSADYPLGSQPTASHTAGACGK